MRIARFSSDAEPLFGVVEGQPGSEEITVIDGDPFLNGISRTTTRHKLGDVRLLAPVTPRSKIIGVARNFAAQASDLRKEEAPGHPLLFMKPNTAVVGPNEAVMLPKFSAEVTFEAELCAIIGRPCKEVSAHDVQDFIFGYTCGNDLTAKDVQATDGQWTRAKGFDTSAPLGPWIETELDISDLSIQGRLNGELRQDGSTALMIHGVNELISVISHGLTLLPGDVIMTGTPSGIGQVQPGDSFEVRIEGIGKLTNPIIRQ